MIYPPPNASQGQKCFLLGWDASLSEHIILNELQSTVKRVKRKDYLQGLGTMIGEMKDILNKIDHTGPECFFEEDADVIRDIAKTFIKDGEILEQKENAYFREHKYYPQKLDDEDIQILRKMWENASRIVDVLWNKYNIV